MRGACFLKATSPLRTFLVLRNRRPSVFFCISGSLQFHPFLPYRFRIASLCSKGSALHPGPKGMLSWAKSNAFCFSSSVRSGGSAAGLSVSLFCSLSRINSFLPQSRMESLVSAERMSVGERRRHWFPRIVSTKTAASGSSSCRTYSMAPTTSASSKNPT